MSDKQFTQFVYKREFKRKLDLSTPKTLNEKILWLKLFNRDPLQTICADKFLVREYVSKKIGEKYLVKLLNKYDDINEIDLKSLPNTPFIIKANHTSGTFKIVKDKNDINIESLKNEGKEWLSKNYYSVAREWQYKNIKPCIIVEELLKGEDGKIPNDIKFICINGKVEMINVDSNKEIKHYRNNYDKNWEPLPFRWPKEYFPTKIQDKPKNLDLLIQLAENLSKDFDFARVDFYVVKDQIYFGEITFHPTSGLGQFSDFKYDEYYGKKLNLS